MLNNIILCIISLVLTFVASGIMNVKKVKREKSIVKKFIACFPTEKNLIIYSIVMLVYMVVLSFVITKFYEENMCSYAKTISIASLMWPMCYIDFKQMRIPNKLLLVGIVYRTIILVFELIFFRDGLLFDLVLEFIGSAGIFVALMLSLVIVKNGIGMGDIKFFMVMGLFLGAYRLMSAILIVMVIALIIALHKLIIKKEGRKAEFAFGPAIAIGSLISFIMFGS